MCYYIYPFLNTKMKIPYLFLHTFAGLPKRDWNCYEQRAAVKVHKVNSIRLRETEEAGNCSCVVFYSNESLRIPQ